MQIYAVAAAIGLATYLIVYGPAHLIGATPYWEMPFQDERQALIGYRYFLHEPWHWPLFVSQAVNVPYPKSVAFLDCVPLWALVNKMIATVVPPWASFSAHAYLGMWHALAYVLQASLGVACLRALGHVSWRTGILTALFLLSIPKVAQLCTAALVYPYHAVFSLGVYFASLARTRDRRTILTWLPLGVLGVLAMMWLVGYFAPETAVPQWGFDKESANLLSWLVPVRSGILGDGRWIANVMGTPWQWEGYAYLGLGSFALMAIALRPSALRGTLTRHAILFAVVLACALLALSNHIYFGSHEIASYRIPRLLLWIPHQFRSPGRFVWLPTYVLLVYVRHRAFTRQANGRRFAVIVVAVVVQVVDASGDWALQREFTQGPNYVQLDPARWRPLVSAHDAVYIFPPHTCVSGDDKAVPDFASMDIQMLASEHTLPINGVYCARPLRHCALEEAEWATLALQPGALYVLLPQAVEVADLLAARGAHCARFAHGRVCSTIANAIDEATRAGTLQPPPAPIPLVPGQPLELAAIHDLDTGWSSAADGSRTITGSFASLLVQVEGTPKTLAIEAEAPCEQDIEVLVDGVASGSLYLHPGSPPTPVRLAIPTLRGPDVVELRPHVHGCAVRVIRVLFE